MEKKYSYKLPDFGCFFYLTFNDLANKKKTKRKERSYLTKCDHIKLLKHHKQNHSVMV